MKKIFLGTLVLISLHILVLIEKTVNMIEKTWLKFSSYWRKNG